MSSPISENQQRLKLLVIDDEKWITELIEAEVEDMEFVTVNSVNDSKLIKAACEHFIPDIIFLDLGLEGYEGVEVLEYFAGFDCKAKIFLISGLDRMSLESYQATGVGFDLNIVGALTKPFTRDDICYALTM